MDALLNELQPPTPRRTLFGNQSSNKHSALYRGRVNASSWVAECGFKGIDLDLLGVSKSPFLVAWREKASLPC